MRRWLCLTLVVGALAGLAGLGGCVVVPQNRRKRLADPMMRAWPVTDQSPSL